MTDKIVPLALRFWLMFLLLFLVLGYSVLTCIIFGAVGGFAASTASVWWRAKGGEPVTGLIPDPIRQFGRQIQQQAPRRIPWGRLVGRRDRRYSSHRRDQG